MPRSPAQGTQSRWIKGETGSWAHSSVGSHPPYLGAGGNQAQVLFPPTSQSMFTVYEEASDSLTALRFTTEKSISPSKDFPCPHAEVWIRHKSRWVRRSLCLPPQMLIHTWLHSNFEIAGCSFSLHPTKCSWQVLWAFLCVCSEDTDPLEYWYKPKTIMKVN